MTARKNIFQSLSKASLISLSAICFSTLLGAGTLPVNLGSAGNFSILAKTQITTTGPTSVIGNVGLSPAAATFITGFGLIADPSNQFSTSSLVKGDIYAADYAPPTPNMLTNAIGDMQTAYTSAAGYPAGFTNLGAGNIGGMTLAAGVYSWGTGVTIPTNLFLNGSSTDVWIFQIAQTLDISPGVQVILSGGAQSRNIFWQVAGQTTLETTSVMYGNILDQTEIVMNTGSSLYGKALAQSEVTLDDTYVISASQGYLGPNPPAQGQTFAYPSPAKGAELTIVYNLQNTGTASIRIWNSNAQLVATLQGSEGSSGPQKSQINISNFAPGVYLYKVDMSYDNGNTESLNVGRFAVIK